MPLKTRSFFAYVWLMIVTLVPGYANADQVAELEKRYKLMAPSGTGPFPTVLMFSGGSGFAHKDFAQHYDVVQKRLVDLGFLTLRMDVLGAIGASSSWGVSYEDVANGVRNAIQRLKTNPKVKGDSLHLIGWSFGGAVSLTVVGKPVAGVRSVMAYYPPCTRLNPWKTDATVKVFYGDKDAITPPTGCDTTFKSAVHGAGSAIKV